MIEAEKANKTLNCVNSEIRKIPSVWELLSDFGKRIFMPEGIIAQSKTVSDVAKSRKNFLQATKGVATKDNAIVAYSYAATLKGKMDDGQQLTLNSDEIYPYSGPGGNAALVDEWRLKMVQENPTLKQANHLKPLPVAGITHGLFICADLFINPGDTVILPDLYWGNYNLLFKVRRQANFRHFSFFEGAGFNINGLEKLITEIEQEGNHKIILVMNFPNNPTGYTPTPVELEKIKKILLAKAASNKILVICDDAYFGFHFDGQPRQSLFAYLHDCHENLLAIKVDGGTKEECSWGLRVGFITTAIKGGTESFYNKFNDKIKGALRSSISSVANISQNLLQKIMTHKSHTKEKTIIFNTLKERAIQVQKVLQEPKYQEVWTAYPFNSGYFMCIKLKHINATALWKDLLENYNIGVIHLGDGNHLRIAFSSLELQQIQPLFDTIYEAAKKSPVA